MIKIRDVADKGHKYSSDYSQSVAHPTWFNLRISWPIRLFYASWAIRINISWQEKKLKQSVKSISKWLSLIPGVASSLNISRVQLFKRPKCTFNQINWAIIPLRNQRYPALNQDINASTQCLILKWWLIFILLQQIAVLNRPNIHWHSQASRPASQPATL